VWLVRCDNVKIDFQGKCDRVGHVEFSERGFSVFLKGGEFIDDRNEFQLSKKCRTAWN
jgi:hypothetical protein